MSPEEKIENTIRKMHFKAGETLREKNLNDALEAFKKSKQSNSVSTKPDIWRKIMRSPITKLAAAAVIIFAFFASLQFFTGTSAYAQAVNQIRDARTMVYTLIRQANDGSGETIKVDMAYKEPGHLRTTTVDGYIAILDARTNKMISIIPQGGYTYGDLKDLKVTGGGPFENIEAMKALPAKADLRLASKDIDGVECDGYQVTQGDMSVSVWLDAKTGDVVQIENKYASAAGMNTIMKNIKLDVPLEDTLFSLTPPAGYKQLGVEVKSETGAQTEEKFVEWLRWWANSSVDEMFPPIVAGSEIAKVVMDMAKQGKLKGSEWEKPDVNLRMFNALLFVANLPADSNWRYAGNGVKFGTADKPIFWYLPSGSNKYRLIYGDLSIKEVAPEDLPK